MFETLESLYGEGVAKIEDRKFIDAVVNVLQAQVDENNKLSLSRLTEKYTALNKARSNFMQYNSTIFENYLVNELFMNLYPFKFNGSITYNYGVFVAIYKLLELITFSFAFDKFLRSRENLNKIELTATIMIFANNIDHNKRYRIYT